MVAAALAEGRVTLAEVSDEKVKDPRILKIARKVTRDVDASFEDFRSASVKVKMRDGRIHQHNQKAALGSPELPAPRETIEDKFRANVEKFISAKKAEELIHTVDKLEDLKDISDLMSLLKAKRNKNILTHKG
jgi:2-methylcitrate dehydratase PrpD